MRTILIILLALIPTFLYLGCEQDTKTDKEVVYEDLITWSASDTVVLDLECSGVTEEYMLRMIDSGAEIIFAPRFTITWSEKPSSCGKYKLTPITPDGTEDIGIIDVAKQFKLTIEPYCSNEVHDDSDGGLYEELQGKHREDIISHERERKRKDIERKKALIKHLEKWIMDL